MSLWTNLLQWGLKAAKTEGQTLGMQATKDLGGQIQSVIADHAPDMAPALQPLVAQLVQGLVAGIMTKTH